MLVDDIYNTATEDADGLEVDEVQAELLEDLSELQLPVIKSTCPRCFGQKTDTAGKPCERCDGEGEVRTPAITNHAEAMRVAKKLLAIARRRQERVEAWQAEQQAIQALIDAENRRAQQQGGFFEGLLTHWHGRVLEVDPKAKTIPVMPGVTCQARKSPDGVDYGEEDLLGVFLLNNRPDLIKPVVRKTELKKEVRFDGNTALIPNVDREMVEVPGVRPKPGEVKFTVKLELRRVLPQGVTA